MLSYENQVATNQHRNDEAESYDSVLLSHRMEWVEIQEHGTRSEQYGRM